MNWLLRYSRHREGRRPQHFYNKLAASISFGTAALIGLAGLDEYAIDINGSARELGLAFMIAGGWGLARTPRAGLWISNDGVRIVALFSTRTIPWPRVAGFAEKRTFYDKGGAFLAVVSTDGKFRHAFTASTGTSGNAFSVRTLAAMEACRSSAWTGDSLTN